MVWVTVIFITTPEVIPIKVSTFFHTACINFTEVNSLITFVSRKVTSRRKINLSTDNGLFFSSTCTRCQSRYRITISSIIFEHIDKSLFKDPIEVQVIDITGFATTQVKQNTSKVTKPFRFRFGYPFIGDNIIVWYFFNMKTSLKTTISQNIQVSLYTLSSKLLELGIVKWYPAIIFVIAFEVSSRDPQTLNTVIGIDT